MSEKRITDLLGIDREVITKKCAKASRYLLDSKLVGGKSQQDFIDFMSNIFDEQEMKFLAIGYITEKTDKIINTLPGLEKFIDEAVSKHGMPEELSQIIKEGLGLRKEETHIEEDGA